MHYLDFQLALDVDNENELKDAYEVGLFASLTFGTLCQRKGGEHRNEPSAEASGWPEPHQPRRRTFGEDGGSEVCACVWDCTVAPSARRPTNAHGPSDDGTPFSLHCRFIDTSFPSAIQFGCEPPTTRAFLPHDTTCRIARTVGHPAEPPPPVSSAFAPADDDREGGYAMSSTITWLVL